MEWTGTGHTDVSFPFSCEAILRTSLRRADAGPGGGAPYVLLYSMHADRQSEWILYVFRLVTSLGGGIEDRNLPVRSCSCPAGPLDHLDEVAGV